MVLVPLSGFSYLNRNILKDLQVTYDVLVPLSGFSYLNGNLYATELCFDIDMFSSPYRGSLISILSPTPPKTQGFYPPFAGQTRK